MQIDIFLRRATNQKDRGKLHTVMFADELEFNIAKYAARSLKEHTDNPTNKGIFFLKRVAWTVHFKEQWHGILKYLSYFYGNLYFRIPDRFRMLLRE